MTAPTESTGMLIVGASQAGVQLAISLRGVGYDEHITLISDEDHRPYQRPALSKEYLQGTQDKERLIFRTAEYWQENNITVRQGVRIVHVDNNGDGSGVAVTATGENIAYRRLALAVGATTLLSLPFALDLLPETALGLVVPLAQLTPLLAALAVRRRSRPWQMVNSMPSSIRTPPP